MKAFIIEDEKMARQSLVRTLNREFEDVEIIGETGSVEGSVEFLRSEKPDIIFMDVELEDGNSFEIFRRVDVEACVIMTTAYDSYAISAFEEGSVDYLLKPIEPEALHRAVGRCRRRVQASPRVRKHFLIQVGGTIIPVPTEDSAFFYSEDKGTYLMTRSGGRYLMGETLDSLEKELPSMDYFRISRSCIVSRGCIESVSRLLNGRQKISATPEPPFDLTVSRARVADFLNWMK